MKKINKMHFGGSFLRYGIDGIERIYITEVIYNNPVTIVKWSDGTKTVSKCSSKDTYSPECGLSICMLKKMTTSTEVHRTFGDWIPTDFYLNPGCKTVKVRDVRIKHKGKDA